jgi:multimeric flavodoxin WrbA
MIEVCGIVGSPNKNGNVDLLVSQVLEGTSSQGAETFKLYLNDMRIRPCQDCGVDPRPRYCLLDDDMEQVYAALDTCDVIVLGSPVYFDTVSAQTKLMIDRCNCLMPYVQRADGTYGFAARRIETRKRGVFVTAAGTDQEFDTIRTTVAGFFLWANVGLDEMIAYAHNSVELGSVKQDEQRMQHAFDIGVRVVGEIGGIEYGQGT